MAVIRFIEDACLVIPDLCVNGRDFYLCHSTHLLHYARDPLFLSDASDADILHDGGRIKNLQRLFQALPSGRGTDRRLPRQAES